MQVLSGEICIPVECCVWANIYSCQGLTSGASQHHMVECIEYCKSWSLSGNHIPQVAFKPVILGLFPSDCMSVFTR